MKRRMWSFKSSVNNRNWNFFGLPPRCLNPGRHKKKNTLKFCELCNTPMTLHYHCEPAVCVYVVCVCDRVVSCCVGPQWFLDGTWRSAARDAEIYLLLYNQVKYHSGGGPDTVEPRGVRETVCLRLRPCPPVCVCLIHNVAETGPCFMTLLLWGHIASLPSSFTTPSNSPPPPPDSPSLCVRSRTCCGRFASHHFPWLTVRADQGARRV